MSIWYWGLTCLVWAMICNWTFGVPNELLIRARKSEDDAELFDRFARRNIAMINRAINRQGIFVGAFMAFVLAVVGTIAFRNNSEAAQGLFLILAPMIMISAWSGRRIQRLANNPPDAAKLRSVFMTERRISMAAAIISVIVAFGFAGKRHGHGWFERMLSAV
ncbi:MAG: hypothetical protein ACPGGK_17680 [Pikeienuella sp.]